MTVYSSISTFAKLTFDFLKEGDDVSSRISLYDTSSLPFFRIGEMDTFVQPPSERTSEAFRRIEIGVLG